MKVASTLEAMGGLWLAGCRLPGVSKQNNQSVSALAGLLILICVFLIVYKRY